jgi:hypothetical protein
MFQVKSTKTKHHGTPLVILMMIATLIINFVLKCLKIILKQKKYNRNN